MRATIGGGTRPVGAQPTGTQSTGTRPSGTYRRPGHRGGIAYVAAPMMVENVVYETDLSPNALYKRYRKWYFENHGNSFDGVMPFREWIKWAKARGVINADGESGDPAAMKYEQKVSNPVQGEDKRIDAGKIIATALLVGSIAGIIIAFTTTAKEG